MNEEAREQTTAAAVTAATRLPGFLVQCDWDQACKEEKSLFWISYHPPTVDAPTLHGTVLNAKKGKELSCEQGFAVSLQKQKKQLSLTDPQSHHRAVMQAPTHAFAHFHSKRAVYSLDLSPTGDLGVSGDSNGSIRVWQANDGILRRDLQGHVGDVNTLKWFPSGKVVLSGSSDYQLKIWDVLRGECGATLKGHAGGILGCGIVDRGRNVVSCSRDSTARLWDVSTQSTIAIFGKEATSKAGPANDCCLQQHPVASGSPSADEVPAMAANEVGTEGKLLIVAHEKAIVNGFDLRNRTCLFSLPGSSAFNCCSMLGNTIIAGAHNGEIYCWDVRRLDHPRLCVQRSLSPINDVCFVLDNIADPSTTSTYSSTSALGGEERIWAASNEGLFFSVDLSQHGENAMRQQQEQELPSTTSEPQRTFTGPDFEPITCIAVRADFAFSACRDGTVRRYKVSF
ncbi:Proteasomal ATPase-associated factor 1 [Balamuthia mandrillaris]